MSTASLVELECEGYREATPLRKAKKNTSIGRAAITMSLTRENISIDETAHLVLILVVNSAFDG